ncbi:hypothetical protein BDY21DRAFT_330683 [Lineolata rhizophorae]|uniref:Homeobox domain-containing protein n=1 Tax=Lineolata rhizophorae TaxID=578093 RepID=A0A6A6PDX0_9PEZI|nr:hypothetical protein BDY21DRAFT_330683 [Lineolata rhizophorae]
MPESPGAPDTACVASNASAVSSEDALYSASSPSSIAFLVHSQDSVEKNLPPDVDNKPLARQKRKRTSPEDQKVLEAAYQHNPKPDKSTRKELARRVALNEKEVQIWFQNRRQNTRRKSRGPLSSQEVAVHFESSVATVHQSSPAYDFEPTQHRDVESESGLGSSQDNVQISNNQPGEDSFATSIMPSNVTDRQPSETSADAATSTSPIELPSSQSTDVSQQMRPQSSAGSGYLANRRCALGRHNSADSPSTSAKHEDRSLPKFLTKASSFVRLSTSWDGKAQIVTDDTQSPSPPRKEPFDSRIAKSNGLQHSSSGTDLAGMFKSSQLLDSSRSVTRASSGRSRDSRAWEFWCDSDARNSLAEKADQQSSGSAADAIGLIRSHSRNTLKPNLSKRNAPPMLSQTRKRSKLESSCDQPQLRRSSSSLGRLQDRAVAGKPVEAVKSSSKGKDENVEGELEVPQTDSDKENWEPKENRPTARRPPPAGNRFGHPRRAPLGENFQVLSQSGSLGAMMDREKRQKSNQKQLIDPENINPEDDEEIAAFMGSSRGKGSGRASVSSGEDFDCVQGLLKLSQGNWR